MKKFRLKILIIMALFPFVTAAQNEVVVAEKQLKIYGHSEETFYLAFSEGDRIIFSLNEVNGKALKVVEIAEYPSFTKFSEYGVKTIDNKTFEVPGTGIYKFRIANGSLSSRLCNVKIQRIPVSEDARKFKTNVYWKKIADTTYTTTTEKILVKQSYRAISVVDPSEFYLNSVTNELLINGKSKIIVPVTLPANTKEWYYVFSSYRDRDQMEKAKKQFNLLGQLSGLIDQTGALGFGIDLVTTPSGGDVCNIYVFNQENSTLFLRNQRFYYSADSFRQNLKSGLVQVNWGTRGTFYIGIENPDSLYGIHVALEVVAIVEDQEWEDREVQKIKVTTKEVPYWETIK